MHILIYISVNNMGLILNYFCYNYNWEDIAIYKVLNKVKSQFTLTTHAVFMFP